MRISLSGEITKIRVVPTYFVDVTAFSRCLSFYHLLSLSSLFFFIFIFLWFSFPYSSPHYHQINIVRMLFPEYAIDNKTICCPFSAAYLSSTMFDPVMFGD